MKKILTVGLVTTMVCSNILTSFAFSDVKQNHWAKKQIDEYVNRNILKGYEDGTFKPNQNITRAEFVKVMTNTFNIDSFNEEFISVEGTKFNDIKGHWAEKEIMNAVSNGVYDYVLSEDLNKNFNFRPNDAITREEASLMVANYLKITDSNLDKISKFKDNGTISYWAKSGIEGAVEKGILNGYDDKTIKPQGKLTRAEAVFIVKKVENFKNTFNYPILNNIKIITEDPYTKEPYPIKVNDLKKDIEIYVSEVIELLNHPYCIGSITPSRIERNEFLNKSKDILQDFESFMFKNKEYIRNYVAYDYTKQILINLEYVVYNPNNILSQGNIAEAIHKLTGFNYYSELEKRGKLVGYNLYREVEFFQKLNNIEDHIRIVSSNGQYYDDEYITRAVLENTKDVFRKISEDINIILSMTSVGGRKYFPEIHSDVVEYLDLYAKWINSLEEDKGVVNGEERFYLKDKQMKLSNLAIKKHSEILEKTEEIAITRELIGYDKK